MEDTSHLETPGIPISDSNDKPLIYRCGQIKKYLENVFLDSLKILPRSECKMPDEMREFIKR